MRTVLFSLALAAVVPCPALHAQTSESGSSSVRSGASTTASGEPGEVADEAAPVQPILRVDMPETEAIPGQFLTLRLTVLVPSFMPKPPVWPSFEAPNLLVRVPEGGTSPVSERIDGKTWSGISRRYLVSPMVPGAFDLPPQDVQLTWAEAGSDEPASFAVSTRALSFVGVLPDGAEDLDPFIAASDLTMTQEIDGEPVAMAPGQSAKREITVEVAGLSPMFLPDLLVPVEVLGLAAYPDEPILTETDNRGVLGGTRRESVSYVAENGGAGTLPEVVLQWYDIDTGTIETARAEAVEISVDGPPAVLVDPDARRRTVILVAAGAVLVIVLALIWRLALPVLRRRTVRRRKARLASEDHAWRLLMRTVSRHDHAALHHDLGTWAARVMGTDPRLDPHVQTALLTLGRTSYGPDAGSTDSLDKAWRDLGAALRRIRRRAPIHEVDSALPSLNPGATT